MEAGTNSDATAGPGDQRQPGPLRLGVVISGSGSNLQSIIDRLHKSPAAVEVAVVISDNAEAYGLQRAEEAGIPTAVIPMKDYDSRINHDLAMADELARHNVDLVVLAGYMLIVTVALLDRFPYKVINLHPSLLPAFQGGTPIEDTIAHGARVTGVTVHFVDEGTDTGPIILQEALEIKYNDTVESLRERIHAMEHVMLPRAIELIAAGRVRFDEANPQKVIIDAATGEET